MSFFFANRVKKHTYENIKKKKLQEISWTKIYPFWWSVTPNWSLNCRLNICDKKKFYQNRKQHTRSFIYWLRLIQLIDFYQTNISSVCHTHTNATNTKTRTEFCISGDKIRFFEWKTPTTFYTATKQIRCIKTENHNSHLFANRIYFSVTKQFLTA